MGIKISLFNALDARVLSKMYRRLGLVAMDRAPALWGEKNPDRQ